MRIEARRFESEGQSRECRGSEAQFCHFIAPAPSRKHQALSAQCRCRSRYRAFSFDQKRMRLTRSTKDRKKGCAYDAGALNKQGALKNQTLRYNDMPPTCLHSTNRHD